MAQYYAQFDEIQMVMQTHEAELEETFQPCIIEHMDYAAVAYNSVDDCQLPPAVDADRILESLPTREFLTIATQKYVIATGLLNLFRDQYARNETILANLAGQIE